MSQFIEYLKMAVSNIKANKMRSFLTMLGIIIGISSVILIMSLGNGAKNVITEQLAGIAAGQIALYTYDDTGSYQITNDDIEAIEAEVKGLKGVNTYMGADGTTSTKKGEFQVSASGQRASYQVFSTTGILKGRYFNKQEYLAASPVCVIGEKDAVRLFGSVDVVGMNLDVSMWGIEIPFTIIGVEKAEQETMFTFTYDNSPVSIYFPLTVFAQIYGVGFDSYYQIYLMVEENADTGAITSQVVELLERRHQCYGEDIYQYESFSDYMGTVNTVINTVTMLISLVAAISLTDGVNAICGLMPATILATRKAPATPLIIPISPPIMVIMADSDKNCIIIDLVFAPSAFRIPISLVRSVTDTSMMWRASIRRWRLHRRSAFRLCLPPRCFLRQSACSLGFIRRKKRQS